MHPVETERKAPNQHRHEKIKDPGLIECWFHGKTEIRAASGAQAINTGQYTEFVSRRRNVGVTRGAPSARLHPVLIEAFQHVAELELVRDRRTWRSELKLETLLSGRNHKPAVQRERHIIRQYTLDDHRKRELRSGRCCWIHHCDALERGKPESVVLSPPARRLEAAVAFTNSHPIRNTVADRPQRTCPASGERSQVFPCHTPNTAIRAHPQSAQAVVENLEDGVVYQPILPGETGELSVSKPDQPFPIRSKPQGSVRVGENRINNLVWQTVASREPAKLPVFPAEQ